MPVQRRQHQQLRKQQAVRLGMARPRLTISSPAQMVPPATTATRKLRCQQRTPEAQQRNRNNEGTLKSALVSSVVQRFSQEANVGGSAQRLHNLVQHPL